MFRRLFLSFVLVPALLAAGCAMAPGRAGTAPRAALAPTGVLRVGVYEGSPTSLVKAPDGADAGVAHDIGAAMAAKLGVPVQYIRFERIALVLEALKRGDVDLTFTNASESRAREVDFTAPVMLLELGYLVPAGSPVADETAVDRPGMRIGVTQGSSSLAVLSRRFKAARLVTAPSLAAASQMLRTGALDAYATNKGILYELSATVPGSRVLPGRWGVEHLALAVPKGREAGRAWLGEFAASLRGSEELKAITRRAGLRGVAEE